MRLTPPVVSMQSNGTIPNYEASAVKLYSMELNQRIANTGVRLMGLYGPLARGSRLSPMKGRMSYSYIRNVANTIEGGTSEVQRDIVAQRGLGLTRAQPRAAARGPSADQAAPRPKMTTYHEPR